MKVDITLKDTLDEIKRKRERLGLTQSDLAELAGVSQPLIARLESKNNRVDPTLSTYLKITRVLDETEKKKVTAKNIYHHPAISVSSSDSIERAVKVMEECSISQLPVIDDDFQVGSISEGAVVRVISRSNAEKISRMPVKEIMEEPFPMIPPTADLPMLSHLLEHHSAVLVQEKGKVVGIITKHDVLRLLHR